ncbi:hypothetical protein [Pseudoalteromonas sp. MMG022]|uniref:5' nucleotidase, NT5C type n=1 Tax=Pseudoalteromonas sp. MMG022 TaxID=2909978 RepID=UPI001F226536|nr:hypothetical protein [Pseudoalteromonas sp. MMG022]MCF6437176.1 hypothetical protein [Pseudoalteromonas sp. MMG022]
MIVYVDMDDVICDYRKAYNNAKRENPEIVYPQSVFGFFTDLEPVEGALEAMTALQHSGKYDAYILTAPSPKNPLCYTEKRVWVEKWLGYYFVERLIISPHKGLLKGDYLIDDHIDGNGQDSFEGRLLQFGSRAYPNWDSVRKELSI